MAKKFIEAALTTFNTASGILAGTNLSAFQVAKLVANQAKALTPVDKGLLRNSIMAVSSNNITFGLEDGKPLSERPPNNSAFVGTATEYAIYQEFGTSRMGAQPFLRPAIELVAHRKSTESVIAKFFNGELNKSTKKVKKKKRIL